MNWLVELIEPFFGLLRLGFVVVLIVVAIACLVDLIKRLRTGRVQFAIKHLFFLTLIAAHAASIAAVARALRPETGALQGTPKWVSIPMEVLVPLYFFGPALLLLFLGTYECSKGRPYYLLVALLYLLAFKGMASLAL